MDYSKHSNYIKLPIFCDWTDTERTVETTARKKLFLEDWGGNVMENSTEMRF